MSLSLSPVSSTIRDRHAQAADPDAGVAELGEAIAALAARLHAATYDLLVLLREFDERTGWNNGFRSCAHWLHWRTGIDLGAAREKVRVARALASLPLIGAAMERGQLSYAKVRAISRVATSDNECQLVDVALAGTAAQVERIVRAWRRVDRLEASQLAGRRHQNRQVSMWVDEAGMVVIRGRLTPEAGAVVQRALEAAAGQLHREAAQAPDAGRVIDEVTPGQRRADALVRVAECALASDLDRGTAGDRYQVVVHVDAVALRADDHPASLMDNGQAAVELDEGAMSVAAETSRRLACDASVVVMQHGADGTVLDVGRKTRSIPAAIRRALAARDRHCQFPGCASRRCDGHHLEHWADGGPTSLENLTLLCRFHHLAVHEGGCRVERGADGTVRVFRPDGTRLEAAPATTAHDATAPTTPSAAECLAADGVTPPVTTPRVWDGGRLDVAWALDVLRDCSASI